MVLFADDSTVVVKCDDPNTYEAEINLTLNKIITWLNNNNLVINLEKTKIMHFYQRIPNINLDINYLGTKIESATMTRFLGVIIDNNLSWKAQTEDICKKVNTFAYALYKLAKIVSIESLLMAYHGYVASTLRYGIIYWGNSVNKEYVFKAQKRCIRAMCGLQSTDSCQPLFKSLKILTLPSLYIYEVNIFVKTNMHLYEIAFKSQYRKLRDKNKLELKVPFAGTALMRKSFFCMAQRIFNKLPCSIKKLNLVNFKRKLCTILIQKCYYCLSDYFDDSSLT